VFSPYYALARRRGRAEPANFCALNVALYGPRHHRWAMTERSGTAVERGPAHFAIGPSALRWAEDDSLVIDIDEVTVPWPGRLRGRVRVHPRSLPTPRYALDRAGLHHWQPIAPDAAVEVTLERPALSWSGRGYLDSNQGSEPLEDGFARWHWSRAAMGNATVLLYDAEERDGTRRTMALRVHPSSGIEELDPLAPARLPTTFWRIDRETRDDSGETARVMRTLEDTPFYARSLIESRVQGEKVTAVHESLSLDRFRRPWVQLILPFRMPRALR